MKKTTHQEGFTIVELMIATAVLSTILLLVTLVMVNIGTLYYKGISQARVQDNTRSITDEVSRYIQLNDQPPTAVVNGPHNTQLVCIGSVRYAYVLGVQIGHQAPPPPPPATAIYHHVLWRDQDPTPGSCPTKIDPNAPTGDPRSQDIDLTVDNYGGKTLADIDPTGTELIADNSRLTQFSMTTTTPYIVSVGVAYGDDDLLCNPSVTIATINSCASNGQIMTGLTDYSGNTILCKGGKGDQFCSTAQLTTTVVGRLQGN